ncbi:MAG: hypothetical protein U5O15_09660 [Candidatus Krumholzibacteriota bacterium]|nr:hypothetical protein [Candidatus Krumholzibacteriota bacterium]
MEVMNHNSNPQFEVASPVEGNTTWGVSKNMFASTTIGAEGVGEMNGTVTLTGNTLNGTEASQCMVIAKGRVDADNNDVLSGNITVIEGPLHLSGNTISSCYLIDSWPEGGLMNDPVEDNDGLTPYNVITFVDFDDNGCCDYPPPSNEKDENGDCLCDGVSPPGG